MIVAFNLYRKNYLFIMTENLPRTDDGVPRGSIILELKASIFFNHWVLSITISRFEKIYSHIGLTM